MEWGSKHGGSVQDLNVKMLVLDSTFRPNRPGGVAFIKPRKNNSLIVSQYENITSRLYQLNYFTEIRFDAKNQTGGHKSSETVIFFFV